MANHLIMELVNRVAATATMFVTFVIVLASPLSEITTPRALPARNVSSQESAPATTTSDGTTSEVRLQSVREIFDVSQLTARQTKWAQTVLASKCNFDWTRLAGRLNGEKVKLQLSQPPARAMFYTAPARIAVHKYYYREERLEASRLLAWEAAHAVDIYWMTEDHRAKITELYHGDHDEAHGWFEGAYEDQIGEAFMEGFVGAFCPELALEKSFFSHETTPEISAAIRTTLE